MLRTTTGGLTHDAAAVLAEIDLNGLPPIVMAVVAVLGVVFVALKFNREDAMAVVAQQSTLLSNMKELNDELAESLLRVRSERDVFLARVKELESKIAECVVEIQALRQQLAEHGA